LRNEKRVKRGSRYQNVPANSFGLSEEGKSFQKMLFVLSKRKQAKYIKNAKNSFTLGSSIAAGNMNKFSLSRKPPNEISLATTE
jgi:hypothetical protein